MLKSLWAEKTTRAEEENWKMENNRASNLKYRLENYPSNEKTIAQHNKSRFGNRIDSYSYWKMIHGNQTSTK